ncbi:unnamed protein product [Plutella xylostella]|uniref:(diamondback moth) hypothetical protein n=1 Tax=Plutella xylostella TaxID=51655 RepID=A0A8S4EZA5_PLUXY|nr:unnamed protein product [Plutella xylostella]
MAATQIDLRRNYSFGKLKENTPGACETTCHACGFYGDTGRDDCKLAWYGASGGGMQAGGGWFLPWGMGVQKFVAMPMSGMMPLVPPLLAAMPQAPPPLRLIAPPRLPGHQQMSGRNLSCFVRVRSDACHLTFNDVNLKIYDLGVRNLKHAEK